MHGYIQVDADVYGGYAACPRARRGRRAKGKPCTTPHPAPRAPRDKRRTEHRIEPRGARAALSFLDRVKRVWNTAFGQDKIFRIF